MQLVRLELTNFKNLKDFQIDFNQNSQVTYLAGQNGCGKSNLMEALLTIFDYLFYYGKHQKWHPTWHFNLFYRIAGHNVHVRSRPKRDASIFEFKIDFSEWLTPYYFKKYFSEKILLPSHIFLYHSGVSERWDNITNWSYFTGRSNQKIQSLQKFKQTPVFYADSEVLPVLLGAFGTLKKFPSFLKDYLEIQEIVSLKLNTGKYRRSKKEGLLNKVYKVLLGCAEEPRGKKRTIPLRNFKEKLETELMEPIGDLEMFRVFELLASRGLLEGAHIQLLRNNNEMMMHTDLSDGEKQFLSVFGAMELSDEENALFLLDEPDTHMNPQWIVDFDKLLDKVTNTKKHFNILLSTHSPHTLIEKEGSSIRLFNKSENGAISTKELSDNPNGLSINDLLYSELFGFTHPVSRQVQSSLLKRVELSQKHSLNLDEEQELTEINTKLDDMGGAFQPRDPIYALFYKAWNEYQKEYRLTNQSPTKENIAKAKSIINNLLGGRNASY